MRAIDPYVRACRTVRCWQAKKILGPLIIAASVTGTACGVPVEAAQQQQPVPESSDPFHRVPIHPSFFQDPLGPAGVAAADNQDVQAELPFDPNLPAAALGEPSSIAVTPDQGTSDLESNAAWVYNHPDYGHFVVTERVTVGGEAGKDLLFEFTDKNPGCKTEAFTPEEQLELGPVAGGERRSCATGNSSVVTIRDGVKAVLVQGPYETNLVWHQPLGDTEAGAFPNVEYPLVREIRLVGSVDEFSSGQALQVADIL